MHKMEDLKIKPNLYINSTLQNMFSLLLKTLKKALFCFQFSVDFLRFFYSKMYLNIFLSQFPNFYENKNKRCSK